MEELLVAKFYYYHYMQVIQILDELQIYSSMGGRPFCWSFSGLVMGDTHNQFIDLVVVCN